MDSDDKILQTKELEVMFNEGLIEDYIADSKDGEEDWIQVSGTWIPFISYENFGDDNG